MPRECHACYGFQCRSLVFRLRQPGRPGLLQPASLLCVHAGPAIFGWGFSEIGYVYVCLCVCVYVSMCVCVCHPALQSTVTECAACAANCALCTAVSCAAALHAVEANNRNEKYRKVFYWGMENQKCSKASTPLRDLTRRCCLIGDCKVVYKQHLRLGCHQGLRSCYKTAFLQTTAPKRAAEIEC
jgi:hypothetical protein